MVNTSEYYRLLCKGRKNLSFIILLSKTCTSLTWVGGFSGLIILLIRWVTKDINFDYLGLWLLFTLVAGVGLGLLLAARDRLDYHLTARWLDQNLALPEILTAADLCLARSCSGPFDERIIEQAELCASQINHHPRPLIKWPTQHLNKQMRLACLTIMVFLLLFVYWKPQDSGSISLQELTLQQEVPETWEETGEDREVPLDYSTEELLEMLSFFHPELAEQAVEALNSREARAFREVLEYAQSQMAADLDNAQIYSEREALMEEHKLANEASQRMGERSEKKRISERTQDRTTQQRSKCPSQQQGREESRERAEDGRNSEREKSKTRLESSNLRLEQGAENPPLQQGLSNPEVTSNPRQEGETVEGKRKADDKPGTGSGEKRDWGELSATWNKQAIIKQREDGKVFEYVLPGADASLPLIDFVLVQQQATETALENSEIPVEYGEFVKNYYLYLLERISAELRE